MKIIKKEYHTVVSEFTFDLDEDEVNERFGSLEQLIELLDSGDDEAIEFIDEHDYERYDDWISDRKGGYDVTYELSDE